MRGAGLDGDEGLDLDRDEPLIEKWRHLRQPNSQVNECSCGDQAWWMVIFSKVFLRERPVAEGSNVLSILERGDTIYCRQANDTWLCVEPRRKPKQLGVPTKTWHDMLPPDFPEQAWLMWNGQQKGLGTLMMPVSHLDKLLQYRNTNVALPHEAVSWTIGEVDVFLGSLGFVSPSRESAMLRCSKRLIRALRGGAMGLEYRVDEHGTSGGVFASEVVARGSYVEICPLLDVDNRLRMKSPLLKRITLRMTGEETRFGIILGFGNLYTVSKTPNLHWSYRGSDEVVLWAADEVHSGRELTVDFSAPPQPLERARKAPPTWQAPLSHGPGKLRSAGYVVHGVSGIHGRGVFTTQDTAAGEVLESCPAFRLDEAGAEALFSYRWGLAQGESDFFVPMGLGSLYNHSESPNAMGSLDVKRSVLEFIATQDLYKGQEVLVSYGDTYFDEDFAGHRKSELLHIEAPQTDGDLELQKCVELQRALIRAFEEEEFRAELKKRARQRQQQVVVNSTDRKKFLGKYKTCHSLIMETEMPILERFGYPHGIEGAMKMQADLSRWNSCLDPSHEAVRNNVKLGALIHVDDPPPLEYWEMVLIQLTILGTEEDGAPQIYRENVPKKARCGYVRFMLSMRFPQTGTYTACNVQLVGGSSKTSFYLHNDSDPLPDSGCLLVAGIGDAWPDTRRPEIEKAEVQLTEWQIVWCWLLDSDAQRSAHVFHANTFKIAGTWDDFKCNDMIWDGNHFVYYITLSEQGWESFQILHEGRWEATLYPDVRDGSPWVKHALRGPDNKGHGMNWTLGKHASDAGEPGTQYKVELRPDERGLPGSVVWSRFPTKEAAAEARLATKDQAAAAAALLQEEEVLQSRKQATASKAYAKEWHERRQAKAAVAVALEQQRHEAGQRGTLHGDSGTSEGAGDGDPK